MALDALQKVHDMETARSVYREVLETFGAEWQVRKCLEELAELGVAVPHCYDGKDKPGHVAEEIADVGIMLEQMAMLFNCETEVERMRRYKLRRLEQRIEEARHERH